MVALESAAAQRERETWIVLEAQSALLTKAAIEAIRVAAEASVGSGSGWTAVESAVAARLEWKKRAESDARKTGISDVEAEYARAREAGEDPLSALERVTAERQGSPRAPVRSAGGTRVVLGAADGIETGRGRAANGGAGRAGAGGTESDTERLGRARGVFEGRWSRMHYTAAAGALSGRFTLAEVDAVLKAAESFAVRVAGVSERTGLAVLTKAAGGELTVAELEAALVRAEAAERAVAEEAAGYAAVERREARSGRRGAGRVGCSSAEAGGCGGRTAC